LDLAEGRLRQRNEKETRAVGAAASAHVVGHLAAAEDRGHTVPEAGIWVE